MDICYRIQFVLLLFVGIAISCKQQATDDSTYRLIRDNLYVDTIGNLYLKTADVSLAETSDPEERKKLTKIRWINVVYCDTCDMQDDNGKIDGMAYLKDVVDTNSFHFSSTDDEQDGDVYVDKNHSYFHKHMADGGTITLSKK